MKPLLLVCALLVPSCGGRTVHRDGRLNYTVLAPARAAAMQNAVTPAGVSEYGPLHPVLIEYLLAGPEGPLASYFATALDSRTPTDSTGVIAALGTEGDVGADLDDLEEGVLAQLAPGRLATGTDFARERTRRLTPHIQDGLSSPPGIVNIRCCRTVDPMNRRFATRWETQGALSIQLFRNREAEVVQLIWSNTLAYQHLSYDVSAVPHAFEAAGELDFATVAKTIVTLHQPEATR